MKLRITMFLLILLNIVLWRQIYNTVKPWVVIACAGTLTGCGTFIKEYKTAYPPEVAMYVDSYLAAKQTYQGYKGFSKPIIISFDDLEDDIAGVCTNFGIKGVIKLDIDVWTTSDYYDRITLVYHELGHCDLNYMFHVPGTLLNSSLLYGVTSSNIDYYEEQLFDTQYMHDNSVDGECEH